MKLWKARCLWWYHCLRWRNHDTNVSSPRTMPQSFDKDEQRENRKRCFISRSLKIRSGNKPWKSCFQETETLDRWQHSSIRWFCKLLGKIVSHPWTSYTSPSLLIWSWLIWNITKFWKCAEVPVISFYQPEEPTIQLMPVPLYCKMSALQWKSRPAKSILKNNRDGDQSFYSTQLFRARTSEHIHHNISCCPPLSLTERTTTWGSRTVRLSNTISIISCTNHCPRRRETLCSVKWVDSPWLPTVHQRDVALLNEFDLTTHWLLT